MYICRLSPLLLAATTATTNYKQLARSRRSLFGVALANTRRLYLVSSVSQPSVHEGVTNKRTARPGQSARHGANR